jgi:8-oxo-dGTP pyrophosphatase MutT (NUDIX family)
MTRAALPMHDPAASHAASTGTYDVVAVVAVVLTWNRRLALLKRSRSVSHDQGRWHCVTGYVEAGASPFAQALIEIWEETGLRADDLAGLRPGPTLTLADDSTGLAASWTVHTFVATSRRRQLRLNDEHTTYRWVHPSKVPRFDGQVHWLAEVLVATELVTYR